VKGIIRFLRVLWDAFVGFNGANDGWSMAGFIAFSGLLSLFPFLIFAATLIGITVGETRSEEIIEALFEIAPEHVALTLEPVVEEVLGKRSSEVLSLSALFAIWVASNAVEALRIAFDRAYQVPDPRNFLQNRALALGIVFLGAAVAALLGVSIILSPLILSMAQDTAHLQLPIVAGTLSYGFGVLVFMGFVFLMHRTLPGQQPANGRVWPGVLMTTLLWVLFATAFSIYLSFTPTYTVTYGTLAGVIITLMFFYLTGAVIIYGAEVNAALNRLESRERGAREAGQHVRKDGHGGRA
jgi:membrane protein